MKKESSVTVGFELEILKRSPLLSSVTASCNFGTRTDSSIRNNDGLELPKKGPDAGIELVSPIYLVPTAVDSKGDIKFGQNGVTKALKDMISCAVAVNSTCGFHLHFGKPTEENSPWNPRRIPGVVPKFREGFCFLIIGAGGCGA